MVEFSSMTSGSMDSICFFTSSGKSPGNSNCFIIDMISTPGSLICPIISVTTPSALDLSVALFVIFTTTLCPLTAPFVLPAGI